jgi:lysophospholipase L1-like esterase
VFAIAVVCGGCSACGSSSPEAAGPDAAPLAPTIVVLGSSTAAGFGLDDESTSWVARWEAQLEADATGYSVVNLAVPGYTTFHALPTGTTAAADRPNADEDHNVTAALEERPRALVVNFPSNDAAAGFSVDETMSNLAAIAKAGADAGAQTWVCTSQPRTLAASGIALLEGVRDRTLEDFGDRSIDFWTPLAAPDGTPLPQYNQGDGIHPNAEGHRLLFERVKQAAIPIGLTHLPETLQPAGDPKIPQWGEISRQSACQVHVFTCGIAGIPVACGRRP